MPRKEPRKVVSVRLSDSELEAVERLWKASGARTQAEYLRQAVLASRPKASTDSPPPLALTEEARQALRVLSQLGNLANQAMRVIHRDNHHAHISEETCQEALFVFDEIRLQLAEAVRILRGQP